MAAVDELDEVVREFLVESHEGLDQLDRDLVALEKDPASKDRLASIFRTIHTIKGTCGFLSFGKLEHVAHVGENLLSRLRDGRLTLNADITSTLLATVDAVRRILADIESTGSDGDDDYADLVARLSELQEALAPAAATDDRPSLVDEAAKLTATAAIEDTPPAAAAAPPATPSDAVEAAPPAARPEPADAPAARPEPA
ncbi:MAG: hypothetical protein FJ148_13335, partial [Deltaproteobacteria bacterium]|nr:hypothetical protein [Deltaproteobacteria bacterium]